MVFWRECRRCSEEWRRWWRESRPRGSRRNTILDLWDCPQRGTPKSQRRTRQKYRCQLNEGRWWWEIVLRTGWFWTHLLAKHRMSPERSNSNEYFVETERKSTRGSEWIMSRWWEIGKWFPRLAKHWYPLKIELSVRLTFEHRWSLRRDLFKRRWMFWLTWSVPVLNQLSHLVPLTQTRHRP